MFLVEMPMRAPSTNAFYSQVEALRANLQSGITAIEVVPGVFKIVMGKDTTYWVGGDKAINVLLIVNTAMSDNFCKVELTSKNPDIQSAPYASDLYLIIKDDIKSHNLLFTSGDLLSDDGIKLWKGIVSRKGKVSVYNTSTHQYVLSPVASAEELEQFIGDASYRKYIFVLSESLNEQRGVITSVAIMEIKRKSNWPLFEV
jgi:hypothetical protein